MSLQINMHRNWNHEHSSLVPWDINLHDHATFTVIKVSNGNDSVTFFDSDISQFIVAFEAALDVFYRKGELDNV